MPSRNLITIIIMLFASYACYSVAVKNRDAANLAEAIDIVEREALYQRTRPELFQDAMKGMLSGLDAHSTYLSGDVFRHFDEEIDGQFGGVGVYFENVPEDGMYVLAVMPGHPAAEAGLQAGDLIKKVDGESALQRERSDIANLMRGRVGDSLTVEFERAGELKTASIKRAIIPLSSVHGYVRNSDGSWDYSLPSYPEIAYIRIKQFADPTTEELKAAFKELDTAVEAIIFDLRNNPGGLLNCATDICDMLLDEDLAIVSTRGRAKKVISEIWSSDPPTINPDVTIVVLINRNSASASEIMAGCLQDHDRATIIGEQSWGKGTVQKVIQMKQGSAALKLTTSSYWRPSGKNIDRYDPESLKTKKWGVRPQAEFVVPMTEADVIGHLKQMQNREIRGLIPIEKQEPLMELSTARFKQAMEKNIDELANADKADDKSTPPMGITKPIDVEEIESLDLEHDEVLDEAIEFLTKPAVVGKIAA
jgi:carboxyl-terminal processing protease